MNIRNKVVGVMCLVACMMLMLPFTLLAQQKKLPRNVVPATPADFSEAKPWVFWYWMHASFSKEAIIADLEAMKEAGIAGAYLAPIKGKTDPPLFEPVIETMSAEWWEILRYTMEEADRLGVKLALLPNDGFATAGGPWITPEMSMQKVVWTDTVIRGGKRLDIKLSSPEAYKGYYQDIATFAFPNNNEQTNEIPTVTTSSGTNAQFLANKNNKKNFSSGDPCWVQYTFKNTFTCKAIKVNVDGFNYQSGRLILQVSDDGKSFREVTRLKPPRAGWLDWDIAVTHAIEPLRSKYFRFVYDPAGSEPGGEDLDAAKWKPNFKVSNIILSSEPRINQFEGKSGIVWRISEPTTNSQISDSECIDKDKLINLSAFVKADGTLTWEAPDGQWTILRMGHTSTGHQNETAGAGKGLECDKFNPAAIKIQFNEWFNKAVEVAGPTLASQVLKSFHVDSWECGSQNWSTVFRDEFKKRRGYDPVNYLPAMAGYPIESAAISERYLYDIRKTIAELITDNFFHTLKGLAHEKGVNFTSETTAPVMLTDGMAHFKEVDVPMGEFWLRSPSHDKFNDVLDAVSGAHVYGKPIVQAEAFTQIRMQWDEHPGNLKTLQDRNYALGINKLVYHVFVHNPWMDRKPGMTLDGIGLYFQRDQTWWKQGKAWVDYATRTQEILQAGIPVADIAVFTGEELPRRAVLPDRFVNTLPGIFGTQRVKEEAIRLKNSGLPIQKIAGVSTGANMVEPAKWINPLNGYAYDSFNPEVLLSLATVKNGRIVLPGGGSYKVLVIPGKHVMQPNSTGMSLGVIRKLWQLVNEGATIILTDKPTHTLGLANSLSNDEALRDFADKLWNGPFEELTEGKNNMLIKRIGKGILVKAPYLFSTFDQLGLPRDVVFKQKNGTAAPDFAYTHRKEGEKEIYFLSNQQAMEREIIVSLRATGKIPVFYDAVSGKETKANQWQIEEGRTEIPLKLVANASLFVILEESTNQEKVDVGLNWEIFKPYMEMKGPWEVQFDPTVGGPDKPVIFDELMDWSQHINPAIRYYSGTAVYRKTFEWGGGDKDMWLSLGELANIATVKVNGKDCGTLWTAPYRLNIKDALKKGENQLEIAVTNTWANRLIGDKDLPQEKRITHTTAPYRLGDQPLLKAGLIGVVKLEEEIN